MQSIMSEDSLIASSIVPKRSAPITLPPLSKISVGAHPLAFRVELAFIMPTSVFPSNKIILVVRPGQFSHTQSERLSHSTKARPVACLTESIIANNTSTTYCLCASF